MVLIVVVVVVVAVFVVVVVIVVIVVIVAIVVLVVVVVLGGGGGDGGENWRHPDWANPSQMGSNLCPSCGLIRLRGTNLQSVMTKLSYL